MTRIHNGFEYIPSTMHYGPNLDKHAIVIGPLEMDRKQEVDCINYLRVRLDLHRRTHMRVYGGRLDSKS